MSRQAKFVTEYVKDGNATRAAKVAGYKHPHVAGSRLLKNDTVIDMLQRAANPVVKKAGYTIERLSDMAQNLYDKPIAGSERAAAINILAKLHRLVDNEPQHQAPNITLNFNVSSDQAREVAAKVIDVEPE